MVNIERTVIGWNGQAGLPGVSVLYGAPGESANADLRTFFNAIKAAFTTSLSWSFPNSGDTIDDATGTLTGGWAHASGGGAITGTATGNFAAGCGMYVQWDTGEIVNGRRLRGRTFLTNLSSAMYQSNGSIDDGIVTLVQTAADNLVATGSILVWHRPTPGGSNGTSALVTSALVPDQVTSLRSRRR